MTWNKQQYHYNIIAPSKPNIIDYLLMLALYFTCSIVNASERTVK